MAAALCVVVVSVLPTGADAAPRQAAIVVDARNGEVLYQHRADAVQAPASLTKMMTLYLTFEAVQNGRLGLDQRVTVSRHAARQPASKIGFRSGTRVRVRDLIRSAAIRSANDSAVVLAEAIAGTEDRFARLMTQKARSLGMNNTTFRNASGLTARGHVSTPRDMAILSRHLMYDFPQYFNIFGRRTSVAFGRNIRNTNRLLGSYLGADGIKTGYTRAAGWNLSASARRGSEHVIAVMFGGSTSRSRNREVARLLDIGFERARTVVAVVKPGQLPSPRPVPNPRREPATLVAVATAPTVIAMASPPAAPAAERDLLVPRPAPNRPPMDEPGWSVDLGAFSQREEAVATLATVAFGDVPGLADAAREVTPLDTDGDDALYGARFTGIDGLTALTACAVISAEGQACDPQPPGQGGY